MAGMGLTFAAIWRYATTRRRLVGSDLSDDELRRSTSFTVGGPIYVLAMAIALIGDAGKPCRHRCTRRLLHAAMGRFAPHPAEADHSR